VARSLRKLYCKIQDFLLQLQSGLKTMILATERKTWLKIRQVAAKLDIAVETSRMYEREGLLLPQKTASGQRLFNEPDIHWISCIRRLIKVKGLNLEGIRRLLALIPCWELRPCSEEERKDCPAFLNAALPCWMIKSQLSEECRTFNCRDCPVYQSASHCDNLKVLLQKMQRA
jgi:MerR family transcriptional regulator/heat shock protein HspR